MKDRSLGLWFFMESFNLGKTFRSWMQRRGGFSRLQTGCSPWRLKEASGSWDSYFPIYSPLAGNVDFLLASGEAALGVPLAGGVCWRPTGIVTAPARGFRGAQMKPHKRFAHSLGHK